MFTNSHFDQVYFFKGTACGWEHYWNKGPHKAAWRFLVIPSPVCFPEGKERPCINLFLIFFPHNTWWVPTGYHRKKTMPSFMKTEWPQEKNFPFLKSQWDFALCKVLFRYTREIGGSLYKGEKKSVKMSGILLLLLLPTTGDMDEKIWELVLKSTIWTAAQWFNWLVRWYAEHTNSFHVTCP